MVPLTSSIVVWSAFVTSASAESCLPKTLAPVPLCHGRCGMREKKKKRLRRLWATGAPADPTRTAYHHHRCGRRHRRRLACIHPVWVLVRGLAADRNRWGRPRADPPVGGGRASGLPLVAGLFRRHASAGVVGDSYREGAGGSEGGPRDHRRRAHVRALVLLVCERACGASRPQWAARTPPWPSCCCGPRRRSPAKGKQKAHVFRLGRPPQRATHWFDPYEVYTVVCSS